MIGHRLTNRLRQHSWLAVGIDLLVVVLGIMIALQVDGWRQRREDRELEQVYLRRLREDLQIERGRMDAAEGFAERRYRGCAPAGSAGFYPAIAIQEPAQVVRAIETASWRSFPRINAFVYGELLSTGRLTLLSF